jgi:hypothetical protein
MSKAIPLQAGETAINHAPYIALDNNTQCIPQHYLRYQHNLASVEKLVQEIDYHEQYPIFVCQDDNGLYLQIGIIGYDNYQAHHERTDYKIVYGRKWRIEPQLPSSEIIQTAFLAIKTAREHEIRELFRLTQGNKSCTPFNNHHDLPLLSHAIKSQNTSRDNTLSIASLERLLERIEYDNGTFSIMGIETRNIHSTNSPNSHSYLVDLHFNPNVRTRLPELSSAPFTLLLPTLNINLFLFELMQHLIKLSNRQVDEHFKFRGATRFSWQNNIEKIGQLSIQTRDNPPSMKSAILANELAHNNYMTDKTRVPQITNSAFGSLLKQRLTQFKNLQGLLPDNLMYK